MGFQVNGAMETDGVDIDKEFSNLLTNSKNKCDQLTPFQQLLWDSQVSASRRKGKTGVRWHPMLIRWCLSLYAKSSGTYDTLRASGFLQLPCRRTLYDYSHINTPQTGFQDDAFQYLKEQVEKFEDASKEFFTLLVDEISIKSDICYSKQSGEFIGFVNLNGVGNDFLKLQADINQENPTGNSSVAKHMLVLMVRGLTSNIKCAIAHFPVESSTADMLYSIIWEAIYYLENIGIKVLCVTADGASCNHKFIKMNNNGKSTHKTVNRFSSDLRLSSLFAMSHT